MEYRDRVRLDRYAVKNPDAQLQINDMVVASLQRKFDRTGRPVESREIGWIQGVNPDGTYDVKLDTDGTTEPKIPRSRLDYVTEKTYPDICRRVATAISTVEKKKDRKKFAEAVETAMVAERFVPAGRILSGLGRPGYDLTLFNCYVFNITQDSRRGITEHWGRLFETYSRGGGVGTPLSVLRPKGTVVRKVNGRSSGSVSWAEQFSQITGAVEQGGSRRGAAMLCQWCWHPDVLELVDVKSLREEIPLPDGKTFSMNKNLLCNANVSILLTEDFMRAVQQNADWDLVFPDTDAPGYDDQWNGNIWQWRDELKKPIVVYRTIKARDLWNRIIQHAWEAGEPGIIFMERANQMSNSWYYAPLIGTNPCVTGDTMVTCARPDGNLYHRRVKDMAGEQNCLVAVDARQHGADKLLTTISPQHRSDKAERVVFTGHKPTVTLVLRADQPEGQTYTLQATPDHRVLTNTGKVAIKDLTKESIVQVAGGTAKMVSCEFAGDADVYDVVNTTTSTFIGNGIILSNCSEQVLPDNAVCNLAHLNLGRYVTTTTLPHTVQTTEQAKQAFDWETLKSDVQMGVRFLDNVNDLNVYHDDAVKKQQLSERRIGLGILGYGDALMRLGLCYGSADALAFTDELMRVFTTTAYKASVQLAKERGAFPRFQVDHFLNSGFMKQMPKDVRALVRKHGIRNVTVTTIAPTGSTAAIMNTSTGCEPFFDLQYTSTTRIGIVKEKAGVVDQIFQQFGTEPQKWPLYVVTAQRGITPEHHVKTQAAMQRWVDSAISKTANLPANATVKDVAYTYMLMWELGCKGGTVYRDSSRDVQVLYTDKPVPVQVVEASSETAVVRPRPNAGMSVTFSEESPIGTIHLTIRHDPQTGDPIDVFVITGKGDASADGEAIGRLMSMILRFPNDQKINQQMRLELIRDQLIDILGRGQVGFGPEAKRSMPDAIAKILNRYLEADFPVANLPFGIQPMKELLDELRTCGGDVTKLDQISRYVLEGDPGNGHDVDEYRTEIETEIKKAEQDGIKLPYDYCPGCGNCTLVIIPGKCPCCRTCGYTQC
jgi:ribonucleotide reductase alpha subunit